VRDSSFRVPLRLTGRFIELVPLSVEHAPELTWALRDPEVSRFLRWPVGSTVEEVEETIRGLLAKQEAGTDLPFATVLRATGRTIGTTRYLRIDRPSHGVEIGGTLVDSEYWRTPVNTESKLLLLRHAFEAEGAHRVQLQTDLRNLRSQRAIERLGAVPEARLREDVLLTDGTYRTSVYYSILESEWPGVKGRLEGMLERPWSPPDRSRGPKVLPRAEGASPARTVVRPPPLKLADQPEMRGRWVHLLPLQRGHLAGLIQAGADPQIWTWMRIRHGDTPGEMTALVEELLEGQRLGRVHPYVVRTGDPERTVGIIRYVELDREDHWVEVGTWLNRSVWRTPVNTEAKFLMFRHAFDVEGVHRLQLKTDIRNVRSQAALARLGAVLEGPMREHYHFTWGGYRTSLYYSILASEWPAVRRHLEEMLARPYDGELEPLAPAA
jgi:N-acetyltransferase